MAITNELIDNNEALKGLSEEQKAAIVTLSRNDEDTVIGNRFATLHNELDAAIKEVSGVDKTTNEKTSTYLRRVLGEQKSGIDTLNTKVSTLEQAKTELEGKIASGSGDKELIETQKATIADLTTKFQTLQTEKTQLETAHQAELQGLRIDNELKSALDAITFKSDVNAEVASVLKQQAIAAVKGMKPAFISDDKGAERLIFHNADGSEARNEKNGLALFTAKELLAHELGKFGIVDDGVSGGGAGGAATPPKQNTAITGAKTRVEFDEIAGNIAVGKGIARGSAEYDAEIVRMRNENRAMFDALPFN